MGKGISSSAVTSGAKVGQYSGGTSPFSEVKGMCEWRWNCVRRGLGREGGCDEDAK